MLEKKIIKIIIGVLFVLLLVMPLIDADWGTTSLLYKRKITIDHDFIDSNLSDFPVMISAGSPDCGLYLAIKDKCRSDGFDIRFYDSSESVALDFEKSFYESRNILDTMEFYVKLPVISSTVDTDFYIYYGNVNLSGVKEPHDYYDTWSYNYSYVCHMNEFIEGYYFNSKSNEAFQTHDILSTYNWNSPCANSMIVLGLDSYMQNYGYINEYISDFDGYTITTVIRTHNGAGDNNDGKGCYIQEGNIGNLGKLEILFVNDSGTMKLEARVSDSYPNNYILANCTYNDNTDMFVTATFTETDVNLYVDGVLVAHNNDSNGAIDFSNMDSAMVYGGFNDIWAKVDHFWVSNIQRNNSWINATYHNWYKHIDDCEGTGFISYGNEIMGSGVSTAFISRKSNTPITGITIGLMLGFFGGCLLFIDKRKNKKEKY